MPRRGVLPDTAGGQACQEPICLTFFDFSSTDTPARNPLRVPDRGADRAGCPFLLSVRQVLGRLPDHPLHGPGPPAGAAWDPDGAEGPAAQQHDHLALRRLPDLQHPLPPQDRHPAHHGRAAGPGPAGEREARISARSRPSTTSCSRTWSWPARLYEAGLFGGYVLRSLQFADGISLAFRQGLPMLMKGKIGLLPELSESRKELAEIFKRTALAQMK